MTIRESIEIVSSSTRNISQPDAGRTIFIVSDSGVEGNLTVAEAQTLLETTGFAGSKGVDGYWGSTGYTGSTGTQGVQGIPGFTGSTGTQGVRGFTGSTGTQGTLGFVGSQGEPGVGYAGSRGYVGSTGTQGFRGFTGSTGTPGISYYTATSIAGGVAGSIPIQRITSSTSFISPGRYGNILQYNSFTNTATWVSTSTLIVGKAEKSDKESIRELTTTEVDPVKFITMVDGVTNYYELGAPADLTYNTNNRILTSPGMTITNTTISGSTITGALVVKGGVGIGGDLQVGGTITANKLVIQYTTITTVSVTTDDVTTIANSTNASSTNTGALIVQGGVGIGKDLRVGGTIYGVVSGGVTNAQNLVGGNRGEIPYQSAPSTTSFVSVGSAGSLLVSNGSSIVGPVFKSTSSILVGFAENLSGGGAYHLPYQLNTGTTSYLVPGANGTVLTSNGSSISWQPGGGGTSGTSTTATNLAGGFAGQIPFQLSTGTTRFFGPGTIGQILVSAGTTSSGHVFTNTGTFVIGFAANLAGGVLGNIPYQNSSGVTQFIATGSNGQILKMQTSGIPIWTDLSGVASGSATTATNLAGGSAGRMPYQYDVGKTGFTNSGTLGQILISGGGGSPFWTTTATILAGGTGGTGVLAVQGDINATKEITAYSGSDIRLKENITTIENALEKVRSLNGVMFDWKDSVIKEKGGDDGYFVRKRDTGIIAQDVEKVLPEVVATRDDGFLAVRYEKLAGLIIQAINELASEVDELKKRIQ